jgi:hypothetical protein
MPRLVNNTSGVAANTSGEAIGSQNPHPMSVDRALLTTIYTWATTWGGAQVQLYISPQPVHSQSPIQWFPLGGPISANSVIDFSTRWMQIKAEVVNASSTTVGLVCLLFDTL